MLTPSSLIQLSGLENTVSFPIGVLDKAQATSIFLCILSSEIEFDAYIVGYCATFSSSSWEGGEGSLIEAIK